MTSRTEPRPVDFRRPPQLPFASWITLQDWRHNLAARTVDNWNRQLPDSVQLRVLGAESMLARDLGLTIADPGWGVELHIGPNYGAQVRDVIRDHPDFPVLIDHLAEPHKGSGVEFADILDLGRFENVYMKLSGLNHFSKDEPHYRDAMPFTRWVAEAFGPDRMA